MAENKAELDKPAGNEPQNNLDPTVHVIPAEFYGAVPKKRSISASERAAIERSTVTEESDAQTDGAQINAAPESAKGKGKKGGLKVALIVSAIILVLGGGGAAAYFFLFAGEPGPVKPTGPVCGNGQCETGESYLACPSDCQKPAPVCGDGACDEGESALSCSSDCQAASAVCGDGSCDDMETMQSCPTDCTPPEPVCGDGECDAVSEDHENCPDDCRPPEPVAGPDLDSDGLTDREEREIFGTDVGRTDSDNDSYIDLNETLNLFDPARKVPALLKDNPGIVIYENQDMGYTMFRPAAWSVNERSGGTTVFTAQEGEYVEINVEPKDIQQTFMDWYLGKNPTVRSSQVSVLESKSGNQVIQSADKLISYIEAGDRVIVMRYDLGRDRMMQYRSTFFMMVQSLKVTEAVVSESAMDEIVAANQPAAEEIPEATMPADEGTMTEGADETTTALTSEPATSSGTGDETEMTGAPPTPPTPVVVDEATTSGIENPPQTP